MKITKQQLRQVIKEAIKEAGRPHSMRSGRSMGDLDREAKMRETDFLSTFGQAEELLELLATQFNIMEEGAPQFLRMMADRLEGA